LGDVHASDPEEAFAEKSERGNAGCQLYIISRLKEQRSGHTGPTAIVARRIDHLMGR
jgi:hypothetical protein